MAVSAKYGEVSIPRVGADEPVFILRAQDALAEAAIEVYRALAALHRLSVANSLQEEIDAFRRWPTKKMPD